MLRLSDRFRMINLLYKNSGIYAGRQLSHYRQFYFDTNAGE
jgi:hypothetical protein